MQEQIQFSYADPAFPLAKRAMIQLIERLTGQPMLKRLYFDFRDHRPSDVGVFAAALDWLDIKLGIVPEQLANIPPTGPCVIVANHPFGVPDGIGVSALIERVRQDFLVLTNAVLVRAPEISPYLLPVDFAGTREALQINIETRQRARAHLDNGGCIVVFPAGGVSTSPDKFGRKPAVDAPWQPFTSQLIQKSKAPVVPVYFHGQNSRAFQIASHINPALRLSLIFKEVRDRIGTTIPVAIGRLIPYSDLAHIVGRKELADELNRRTYALAAQLPNEFAGVAPRRHRHRIVPSRLRRRTHMPRPVAGLLQRLRERTQ